MTRAAVPEVLPNGVRLVVRHRPDLQVTAVAVAVAVGWRDEPRTRPGTAHLFEHLLLAGAAGSGPGGYAREVEGLGGRFNATTRADTTVFHVVVPAEAAAQAVRAQARLVAAPAWDEDALAREVAVVAEELRARGGASPYGRFPMTELRARMFTRPENRLDGAAALAAPTLADAAAFHRDEYAPERVCVAVVGGGDDLLPLAREAFGALAVRPGAPRRPLDEPVLAGGAHAVTLPGVPYPAAAVGYRVPDPLDLDRYLPVLVLAEVLGDRWSHARPDAFVSATAAVDLLGDPLGVRDPTGLVLRGMLHAGRADAADLLHRDLCALDGVDEDEVGPAGALLATRLAQGLDDGLAEATALAVRMRLSGGPADLDDVARRLRAVRAADVARAARDLRAQDPVRVVLTAVPAEAPAAVPS